MKRTQEGKLLTQIVLQVFKLSGLLVLEGDQLIKDLGLTSARWKVLGAISRSDHLMTVPDIARMMGQSRQAVQRLFNELKGEGLLDTQSNPNHKRAKFLVLTEKGDQVCAQLDEKQIPWVNLLADELKSADLALTSSVLQGVIAQLEKSKRN